jgi:[NiFe] hydrogenase diaphorase moiety small subunit
VRGVKTQDGKNIFGLINCGKRTRISFDPVFANNMSDEQAKFAMDICPVGTILKKEIGFAVPIGRRKFDSMPIGRQP